MQFTVVFEPSGIRVSVEEDTLLLEAARSAGLPVASSCGANGVCSRCGLELLEGEELLAPESQRETEIKARNRIDPRLRLGCRTRVAANLRVTAPYW
jgi:ferredoxin